MKRSYFGKLLLTLLFPLSLWSQNAPVTKVVSITNATAGPVTVPVTVTNFVNIGAISLTLQYSSLALNYVNITPNPVLAAGISITPSTGQLVISWIGSGINLPDQTHLFDINFTYSSGSSLLTWYDNGGSCEYSSGSSVILNDSPTSTYYIDGIVTNQAAPVTFAPTVTNAVSGSPVSVPITVNNFTNMGAISLTLEYDPNVLVFQSITPNPAISAWTLNTTITIVNGKKRLIISCYGDGAIGLDNGSTLFTISYTYTASLLYGNYSELTWINEGGVCEYATSSSTILYDLPTADYYKNGLVTRQLSPKTYLTPVTNASPGGDVFVPVMVQDYSNITSLFLEFEYDPTIISFTGVFTPNPVFGGNLGVTDWPSSNGKRKTRIGYYGSATNIGNGELVSIKYHYTSGSTALTWRDYSSTACDYGDINGYSLYNTPTSDYYFDGVVTFRTTPVTMVETSTGTIGSEIIIPVKVTGFTNIGAISLTLDYDPGALIYLSSVPNCAVSTNFVPTVACAGRLTLSWIGSGVTLSDNSTLAELHFTYNSGLTPLLWYDNGGSCQYADGSSSILYDQPQSTYYIDGQAGSGNWSGNISTDWNIAGNWLSNIVPTSTITAIIPSSPIGAKWPTLTGDLTLGSNCKNVILEGTSQLTITGNLTINPGYQLNLTGGATLKLGGNWSNSGVFNPGTGTVDFTGSNSSEVLASVAPINNIKNFQQTTFAAGMDLSDGETGPVGNDEHLDVNIGFNFNYLGTVYTDLRINTNGWVSLNESGDDLTSADNSALFNATAPNTTLAPWWDDLYADGSSAISYKLDGSTPNRVFTVEWKDVLSYATDAESRLNFQVKLYETTNVIEFCYGSVVAGKHNDDEGASIGLDDATGENYLEATTGSNIGCAATLKSSTNWPTVNYRFTPPPEKETFYKIIGSKTEIAPNVPQSITISKDIIITKP